MGVKIIETFFHLEIQKAGSSIH